MKILLLFPILFFCSSLTAQSKIAVVNATTGATKIVSTLDSAISISNNGDYIYLPGGGFTLPALDKSVHIYGAGYNQDSSNATGITVLNSSEIHSGASNGSIEGVFFTTNYLSINVSNYTINYCYLQNGIQFYQASDGTGSSNLIISNCYIGYAVNSVYGYDYGSLGGTLTNSIISNNVIIDYVGIGAENTFANNIFFESYASAAHSNSCNYNNNVFQFNAGSNDCSNSIFNNNINAFPSISNGNSGSGNISEIFNNSFINPGTGPVYSYDVHDDYQLKTSSLGHNTGTDGKDMGIYGGIIPWKDGSMPSNPHISSKNVSQQTDVNGNLKATFKVKAQNN
jgi:hypothetical protein